MRTSAKPFHDLRQHCGVRLPEEPPAVSFGIHGKLITVHPREIAINALKDEEEADSIRCVAKRNRFSRKERYGKRQTHERRTERTGSF